MDRHDHLATHIRAARSGQTARLMARAARAEWPGGVADRVQPGALDWVRRWRPRHPLGGGSVPRCGCATGRCLVCN
jgi:hypothetical protein